MIWNLLLFFISIHIRILIPQQIYKKKNDICANWIWKIHFSLEKGTIMRVEYKINAEFLCRFFAFFILAFSRTGSAFSLVRPKVVCGTGRVIKKGRAPANCAETLLQNERIE